MPKDSFSIGTGEGGMIDPLSRQVRRCIYVSIQLLYAGGVGAVRPSLQ